MRKSILIFRIILPSILCVLTIKMTNMSIDYYPLSFGLIIALVNWNKYKINYFFGISLCLIFSYIAFFGGYFSIYLTGKIFESLGDYGKNLALIVSSSFIAPLLIFLLYRVIFCFFKSSTTYIIIITSIILLSTQLYVALNYDKTFSTNLIDNKIFHPFTIWQVIMALAIQLIIYQKELKTLFKPKNV